MVWKKSNKSKENNELVIIVILLFPRQPGSKMMCPSWEPWTLTKSMLLLHFVITIKSIIYLIVMFCWWPLHYTGITTYYWSGTNTILPPILLTVMQCCEQEYHKQHLVRYQPFLERRGDWTYCALAIRSDQHEVNNSNLSCYNIYFFLAGS